MKECEMQECGMEKCEMKDFEMKLMSPMHAVGYQLRSRRCNNLSKRILLILPLIAMIFLTFSISSVDAQAAKKSKAKVAQQSAEEVQLAQLIAYRDALVSMGASQADIDYANKAIEITQNAIIAAQTAQAQGQTAQAQGQAAQAQGQAAQAQGQATTVQPVAVQVPTREAYDKLLQKGFKKSPAGVIFIGDSRFVQMREALNGYGALIIAQGWMGHDWMMETAIPEVDPAIGKGCKVVINLGVNDLKNVDKYIEDINAQAVLWAQRGIRVYYATVNPREDNNYQVDEFNKKMIERLQGVTIIDTNTFLKNYGYRLVDNVHYDGATNINIYSYIMSQL